MGRAIKIDVSLGAVLKCISQSYPFIAELEKRLSECFPSVVKTVHKADETLVLALLDEQLSCDTVKRAVEDFLKEKGIVQPSEITLTEGATSDDGKSSDLLGRIRTILDGNNAGSAEEVSTGDKAESDGASDAKTPPSVTKDLDRLIAILEEKNETTASSASPADKTPSAEACDETPSQSEDESSKKTEKKSEMPVSPEVKALKDQIDALVGVEEFKALADEIITVAPQIVLNKTPETFTSRNYIFSINEGYGLTTYLTLLRDLVDKLGIKRVNMRCSIHEVKIAGASSNNPDPFSPVQSVLDRGSSEALQFLCIDISEWMNKTESSEFKSFLHKIDKCRNEFIVFFRIPFVDKEVLSRIYHSLRDMVFVKPVSFPPLTHAEIRRCAQLALASYGFEMSDQAWRYFDGRISEEKSDGKFYGINTVRKVVRELLYIKQLSNGKNGICDHIISEADAAALCERKEDDRSAWDMLSSLVGAEPIRQRLSEIVSQIELANKNADMKAPCIHMRFVGNPGTGKTTVARIVGKILKEKGVLRVGNFYEYAGRDLVGRYIGETAPKTASICRDAYGSVLFIDEAYSLYRGPHNEKDFGREALDTLIAEMENHRSDLVVIMAGYTDDMETLMEGNAGLASRMPYIIEFPNFTKDELYQIFVSMIGTKFSAEEGLFDAAKEYFLSLPDEVLNAKEFSNARFVRNLFERVWAKAALRTQLEKNSAVVLTRGDFERSTADKEFRFNEKKKKPTIGFMP